MLAGSSRQVRKGVCQNLTRGLARDNLFVIRCWEGGANPSLPRNCKR
jgi:hypothetical protein